MPTHYATTRAFEEALVMTDEEHVRTLYLAATKGIPDGNLHLALETAIRNAYQAHVLQQWKRS